MSRDEQVAPTVVRDTWGPLKIIPDDRTRDAWRPIVTESSEDEGRNESEESSD